MHSNDAYRLVQQTQANQRQFAEQQRLAQHLQAHEGKSDTSLWGRFRKSPFTLT